MYACNVNALPAIESQQCLYSTKQKPKEISEITFRLFTKMDHGIGYMSKNPPVDFIIVVQS